MFDERGSRTEARPCRFFRERDFCSVFRRLRLAETATPVYFSATHVGTSNGSTCVQKKTQVGYNPFLRLQSRALVSYCFESRALLDHSVNFGSLQSDPFDRDARRDDQLCVESLRPKSDTEPAESGRSRGVIGEINVTS
jgi:hypothetical protein